MKKIILLLFALSLLNISCDTKKEKPTQEKESIELKKEIIATDSISTVIENSKIEIENASKKLDELLNDIEK